ncbi:tetratricopeptide repeat protein [Spirosoma soli]|uniref:Tetratricopeptide repeat protein n=1 Tax=Spirosoma soli TaxID=1770529 RepID=A0ABW5MBH3_9BACT
MLELTTLTLFIGYIIYLRYYADQRTNAQKEAERLKEGIHLYTNGQFGEALSYFNQAIAAEPKASVAYLYRARIYRALGDSSAAIIDIDRGKSYDDTVADLHLESGQIHYERGDYQAAFLDFDKAVFHAHGDEAEPYHWRGLARQRLHQDEASRQDLERADALMHKAQITVPTVQPTQQAFFDRAFLLHMGLIFLSSLLLLFIIKRSPVIHWPYLTAAISAVSIGFLEPRKGWALALQQAVTLWVGYTFATGAATLSSQREVEVFSLYGSIGLTFAGSLLGSVIKRAQG